MVVAGVAERVPERLACLAYLDTLVPSDGQSWLDLLYPELRRLVLDSARAYGDGWRVSAQAGEVRLAPHPVRSVMQPLQVGNPLAERVPRACIHCTAKPEGWFFGLERLIVPAARAAQDAGW